MPGPLSGVRVLDASTIVLGPLASQQLADLGADVIKIETPAGDTLRRIGVTRNPGMSAYFLACNRNKRSLVLNLKHASAQAALTALIARADVFLHNFRPATAERLNLSYGRVRAENPSIVYCATYGYSATGPYGDKPAYDDVVQAASGFAAMQSVLTGAPRFVPSIIADKTASNAVAQAILAALVHKFRTGEGQAVEVPMFETLVAWNMVEHLAGSTYVPPLGPPGLDRHINNWRRPFQTKDGYLAIWPYEEAHWRDFFAITGRQDLQADPRYGEAKARQQNIENLFDEIAKILVERTNDEWMKAFAKTNIAVMPVSSLDDLLKDPHLEATGFWQTIHHPTEGKLLMPGLPTRFSGTPASIHRHQPLLGEHSREILKEAGLTDAAIAEMFADGAAVEAADAVPAS